jgi:ribonuclease BN (tRNA processing enzyme)
LPESGIVLDCGSGAFRLADLIQTDSLDILLSHAHLDHTLGLTFLLDILYQCEQRNRPVKQVRVWGEAAKLEAVQNHLLSELIFPAPLKCQWMPIDDKPEFDLGDCNISWRPQNHPGGSVAYRIDWNSPKRRLVYATDTTGDISDDHADWSSDADLLLHECYFRSVHATWATKTGHSWTERVAEVATKSEPRKVVLTHINPIEPGKDPVDIDEIRRGLTCDVLLAKDHMVVDF